MADSLKILFRKEGEAEPSGSNHPLYLNNPDNVWLVAGGRVDVFAVCLSDGQPVGARSYFFSLDEGDLLFGIGTVNDSPEKILLAVGSNETSLHRLSLGKMVGFIQTGEYNAEFCKMVDAWIQGLSFAVSKDINPETDILIEQNSRIAVPDNKKFRSRKGISWVQFSRGNALFVGIREMKHAGYPLYFPLTSDSWAQSVEDSEIATFSTLSLFENDHFRKSLDHFHEAVMFCELLNTKLLMVDEINRVRERNTITDQKKRDAFYRIASVLNKKIDWHIKAYDPNPLVMACRYVASHAGIDMKVPERPKHENQKPVELDDISRISRFRYKQVALDDDWWKSDSGPLLGFSKEGNHPVALIPTEHGRYYCIDPRKEGSIRVDRERALLFKPTAVQFFRPFPARPVYWKDLLRFGLRGTKSEFLLIFFVGLTGGLLGLLLPVFTGVIFDKVIPHNDTRELVVLALAIFTSALSVAIFQLVRSFAMLRVESKMDFQLQAAFWDRILNMPVSFFRHFNSGELAAKANTLSFLRRTLSRTVINALVSSLFAIFNYGLLFYYDPVLALITTGIFILSIAVFGLYGLKIYRNQKNIILLQNKISGLLIQFLNSISKLKIAGAEISAFSLWAEKFSNMKRASVKVKAHTSFIQVFISILPVVATLVIFATTAYSGRIFTTGDFLAFFTAFTVSITIILQLGMAGISFYIAAPMYEDLKPVLETLPENAGARQEIVTLNGEIEMNEINFRYHSDGPLVLKNLSLHILPGEYVAVVGPSGSGKSTLIRILLGFEIPESGSVYYDRQDLAGYDPASVRRQIGTVLQESKLAPGPILSNITGVSDATVDDAWAAAAKVGLDEDIRQMPMGMFTVINDGLSTLSGGQRQRILLAKAIVSSPRILFLDEATSALDNKTQRTVTESLGSIQATRIVIAHRLSTIVETDRIYVLEKGQITEEGTYNELISKKGHFASLVERQMIQ